MPRHRRSRTKPPLSLLPDTWDAVVDRLGLSRQQARVVAMILPGERDGSIASQLHLRVATVRRLRLGALRRVGVSNAIDLLIRVLVAAAEVEGKGR